MASYPPESQSPLCLRAVGHHHLHFLQTNSDLKRKHIGRKTVEAICIKRRGKFQRRGRNYTQKTFSNCLELLQNEIILGGKNPKIHRSLTGTLRVLVLFNFPVLMTCCRILINLSWQSTRIYWRVLLLFYLSCCRAEGPKEVIYITWHMFIFSLAKLLPLTDRCVYIRTKANFFTFHQVFSPVKIIFLF